MRAEHFDAVIVGGAVVGSAAFLAGAAGREMPAAPFAARTCRRARLTARARRAATARAERRLIGAPM